MIGNGWDPNNTYIIYILEGNPAREIHGSLTHFTLPSDGLLIWAASTKLYEIPEENINVVTFDKSRIPNFKETLERNNNILMTRIDKNEFYSKHVSSIPDVIIYEKSPMNAMFALYNENGNVMLFLHDHGNEDLFFKIKYTDLIIQFVIKKRPRSLRIFNESCNSGGFIQKYQQYIDLYNDFKINYQIPDQIRFDPIFHAHKLCKFLNDDFTKVQEAISFASRLRNVQTSPWFMIQVVEYAKIETTRQFIKENPTFLIEELEVEVPKTKRCMTDFKNLHISTFHDMEIILLLMEVTRYSTMPNEVEPEISTFFSLFTEVGYHQYISARRGRSVDEMEQIFNQYQYIRVFKPPLEDVKIITSSGILTKSLSYPSVRTNPITKVVPGSPFMSNVFNEVFFNFTDSAIDFEQIKEYSVGKEGSFLEYPVHYQNNQLKHLTKWVRLFQGHFETKETSNDRLLLPVKQNIIAKVALFRLLVHKVVDFLNQQSTKPLSVLEPKVEACVNGSNFKIPDNLIKSTFAEYEHSEIGSISAITASAFGIQPDKRDKILRNYDLADYQRTVIQIAIAGSDQRNDAITAAGNALLWIMKEVQTMSVEPDVRIILRSLIPMDIIALGTINVLLKKHEEIETKKKALELIIKRLDSAPSLPPEVVKSVMSLNTIETFDIDDILSHKLKDAIPKIIQYFKDQKEEILSSVMNYIFLISPGPIPSSVDPSIVSAVSQHINEIILNNKSDIKEKRGSDEIVELLTARIPFSKLIQREEHLSDPSDPLFQSAVQAFAENQRIKTNIEREAVFIRDKRNEALRRTVNLIRSLFPKGSFTQAAMLSVISSSLLDRDVIKAASSTRSICIDENPFPVPVAKMIAKKFRANVVVRTTTTQFPKSFEEIDKAIPNDNQSIEECAINVFQKILKKISFEQTDEEYLMLKSKAVGVIDLEEVVPALAFELVTSYHCYQMPVIEIVSNFVQSLPPNVIENFGSVHIIPTWNDFMRYCGYLHADLSPRDQGREGYRISDYFFGSNQPTEDESDEYYSDTEEPTFRKISYQFHESIDEIDFLSSINPVDDEMDEDQIISDNEATRVVKKVGIPLLNWSCDIWEVFLFLLKERLDDIGVDFDESEDFSQYVGSGYSIVSRVIDTLNTYLPVYMLDDLFKNKGILAGILNKEGSKAKQIEKIMNKCFKDASYIVSPFYYGKDKFEMII